MTRFTVDRIEENTVVLEDENGDMRTLPSDTLPSVAAGDVLRYENGVYTVDADETAARRAAAFTLEQKLKAKFQA